MPSLKTFTIELFNPTATYLPGEEVSGNVIVELSKEKEFRALIFNAKGKASVHWEESSSRTDSEGHGHSTSTSYSNFENYFDITETLVGTRNSNSRVTLPIGVHKYPFSFWLPNNIPGSFEHEIGHVRYIAKAVIDRPWKLDQDCKAVFTIAPSLDINKYPEQCCGIDDEVSHDFCCFCIFCCINQGRINIDIRLPTAGYVIGETIITTVNFKNSSETVQVNGICTKLLQNLVFHSTAKTRTVSNPIKSTKDSGPFSNQGSITSELTIPQLPPSNLEYCNIIDLKYLLVAHVHFIGSHCKLEKSYPILIGTVPRISPSAPTLDVALVDVPMPMQLGPPYPTSGLDYVPSPTTNSPPMGFVVPAQTGTSSTNQDTSPPSYEECMSGIQNIVRSNIVHDTNDPSVPTYLGSNYLPQETNKDK